MTSAKKKDSFESDLEKLEEIVSALEEGGLPLEDALKQFEEGVKLSRKCEKALSDAEKKIDVLMKNADGELETAPFEEGDDATATVSAPKRGASPKKQSKADDDFDAFDEYDPHDEHGGSELF